jgi:hypothetical protein
MAAAICASASAFTITGLTPSTVKVKVGQPITFTVTATGVPAQGAQSCFFWMTPGDGNQYPGPETLAGGFVAGSAKLSSVTYTTGGTFTLTVTPRSAYHNPQNPLLTTVDDNLVAQGVQPCNGSASATVTVWDPSRMPPTRVRRLTLPPPPAGKNGPNLPGPGPVEVEGLNPGLIVALNPQPLPPGAHIESAQTGAGVTAGASAVRHVSPPYVRSATLNPSPVHEGQPVQIAITADPGCNAVLIAWGDGTTLEQSLAPHGRPLERPIQHVYRKMGAETVKVSGEHGCFGQATAAVTVTVPLRRPMGSVLPAVHH